MRWPLLPPILLLAACGGGGNEAQNEAPARKPAAVSLPELDPPTETENAAAAEEREQALDAAGTLRRYYALIEAGDLEGAWAMRARGGDEAAGRQRFLDNFKAYESYRATVGTPSRPARAEGWEYVEVPVMIYGSFRGGKGFGNSGSVTLRRAVDVDSATSAERRWHIYTG
jgi:hypothetical protein